MLKVGISEVDITPAPGKPRAGMPYPQKGQGTAWPLMGRILVFDDGASQAAIITLDLLFLTAATVDEYRRVLANTAGIRPNRIMIACTHTHWAPHTTAIMDEDADFDYLDFVRTRLVQGMAQAWAERQPARLKVSRIDAPGWAFNRRPVYRTPYGEQVGTQGPQWIPEFVRMEGPDDPELRRFMAETLPAGRHSQPIGGLVNFACHTTVGPDEALYSADYPGPLTARLAQEIGGIFGFLQGCAGNIWQMNMTQKREPIYQENGSTHTLKMGPGPRRKGLDLPGFRTNPGRAKGAHGPISGQHGPISGPRHSARDLAHRPTPPDACPGRPRKAFPREPPAGPGPAGAHAPDRTVTLTRSTPIGQVRTTPTSRAVCSGRKTGSPAVFSACGSGSAAPAAANSWKRSKSR